MQHQNARLICIKAAVLTAVDAVLNSLFELIRTENFIREQIHEKEFIKKGEKTILVERNIFGTCSKKEYKEETTPSSSLTFAQ